MEDTIELRQLIDIILKGKVVIIVSTIVCMILASIVSWFVLDEKYESKAVIQVVSNVQDTGVLTNYIAAEFTPNTYAQRIKNKPIMVQALQDAGVKAKFDERNLIATVEADPAKNYVQLTYRSKSAADAQRQLQILMDATKQTMDEAVRGPLQDLELTYEGQIAGITADIETIIENYNKLIREHNLPKILMLQTILDGEITLNISEEQIMALANVNGRLQNQLLQMQTQIKTKSEEYRKILANYESVQLGLESFKADPFVRVIAEPTLAENASSPNKALNVAIGLILGLMLGIGFVLFRYYWKNSVPVK